MKKLTAIILMLALLLSALCVPALAESWPKIELKGTPVVMNTNEMDKDFRQQSHSGPGRDFSESGAYLPRKLVSLTAHYRENGYVLAEVDYRSGKRFVYFLESDLQPTEAETVTWTAYPATVQAGGRVYYGPGTQYSLVTKREESPYIDFTWDELMILFDGDEKKIEKALEDVFIPVTLDAGSRVSALFEVNGWVFCEFTSSQIGLARAWFPAEQLAAD
jgi:hypothetical protein